jgi:hypothetical protein
MVRESIARDFIRELLPSGFELKSGLVFDADKKRASPQCDAIIYKGVPLLEYTDAVVVKKEQVKAIFEIKTWIRQRELFGRKTQGTRNPNTGLAFGYNRSKEFLPSEAKFVLFTFSLASARPDDEVVERLTKVSDLYAVVRRREPRIERNEGKKSPVVYNFDNSVSRLIEWLRNLV